MSRIEKSLEKAVKLKSVSTPVIRKESLPSIDVSRPYHEEEMKQAHLRDYLDVLIRRKWIVILFLCTVVISGTVATFLMKPLYLATTTIQLKKAKLNISTFKDVYYEQQVLETQYNILKSKNLAAKVSAKLALDNIKEDGESISSNDVLGELEIIPIKKSDLVTINFVSPDPAVAANVANTLVDEYINYTHYCILRPTQVGGERLKKEVDDMRAKLEKSEKELNEYIAKSQFLFTKNDQDYENLLSQKFSILSGELNQATSERISKEAIYQEVKKSGIDYSVVLENPLIRSLTMEYIKLESKYFELLKIHKPEYPKMIQLKDQIENLKDRISVEEQKIINTLQSDYQLALKKEKLLSSAIEKLRQDVTGFQHNMIQFQILKREVETNREIYNSLLQRLKEVDISTALTENDVDIIDRAKVPIKPYKPKKVFNIIISLLFGLIGGIGLAFFAEYFDNSIKTDADVEKVSSLPVLGKIPISKINPKKLINNITEDSILFSEAFRSISTCINFTNVSRLPKHILITSPLAGEGKTIISTSLARSLIKPQGKGIMIDADLRRPDIHTLFNLDNSIGLSTFLTGASEINGLIKKSPYPGLDIITAGPIPPNPSELLNSSRMKELVDALSAAYDYVIFDSAPVLGMSDSLILSTIVECVILVVKSSSTPGDALSQTSKALRNVTANIVGVILNGVSIGSRYTYSSYYNSPYLNGNGKSNKIL